MEAHVLKDAQSAVFKGKLIPKICGKKTLLRRGRKEEAGLL